MASRVVEFFSDGLKIKADYILPEGAKPGDKLPGMVMCQGFGGIRRHILPAYAKHFVAAGYAVCAFDYRGLGDSEGQKDRLISTEHGQDIRAALTWLSLQPEIDPSRLGLWGTSGGAANVIYVAGLDQRVKCTVAQVGYGDGYDLIMRPKTQEERLKLLADVNADREQRVLTGKSRKMRVIDLLSDPSTRAFVLEAAKTDPGVISYLTLESAEAALEYRPIDYVHRIAPRAVMMIAGEKDDVCAPEAYREVYDRAHQPKRWITYPIGHYDIYANPWLERSAADAIEWFKQHH